MASKSNGAVNDLDVRTIPVTDLSVRDDEDGTMKIEGYGAVFNQRSEWLGFYEYLSPDAFDGVDMSNVMLLYAHDFDNILSRSDSGTLTVSVDDTGLKFSATLPNTTLGRDTYENVKAGNVKGCSFGFTIDDDDWSEDTNGDPIHTIKHVDNVREISLTPIPAYTQTSVAVQRSLDKLNTAKENRKMQLEEMQKQIEELKRQLEARDKQSADEQPADEPAKDEEPEKADEPAEEDKRENVKDQEEAKEETAEPDSSKTDSEPVEQRDLSSQNSEERSGNKMPEVVKPEKAMTHADIVKRDQKTFLNALKYIKDPAEGTIKRDAIDGIKVQNGQVFIPDTILPTYHQNDYPFNLSQYVTTVTTGGPAGRVPVVKRQSTQLMTKDELAKVPDIQKPTVDQVTYSIQTYAGQLPISWETEQDSPEFISDVVTNYVSKTIPATEQYKIGALIKAQSSTNVSDFDGLKDLANKGMSTYTNKMFVVTESLYAELDKIKDGIGRYQMQANVNQGTGFTLFGLPLVIVKDDVLGNAGDKLGFFGDLKSFALEVKHPEVYVKWAMNDYFADVLTVGFRADFKVLDAEAGKFFKFTGTASKASSTVSTGA